MAPLSIQTTGTFRWLGSCRRCRHASIEQLPHLRVPYSSLSRSNEPITYAAGTQLSHSTSTSTAVKSFPLVSSSVRGVHSISLRHHLCPRFSQKPSPRQARTPESHVARWWFQSKNTDALLVKDDRAGSAQEKQDKLHRKYRCPKNPVVLCHGLLGYDSLTIGPAIAPMQVTYWRGIKEVLEANGIEVLITRVPATSSPIDRAKVLEKKVSAAYPGRSVHLIGHSMGGLDCRYLTTHLTDRAFRVLSITTIATPHRGSPFADHFLATVGRARMPSLLSLLARLPNGTGDGTAFECLTLEGMRRFNEATPDDPAVRYYSWGAAYVPGVIDTWRWPHAVIYEREGENDGLVSVASSKWGTYLGTLQNVSHLDLVGWMNPARYRWAALRGREIAFRPATFYLGVADLLAEQVEGQRRPEEESALSNAENENEAGRGADLAEDSKSVDEPAGSAAQPR